MTDPEGVEPDEAGQRPDAAPGAHDARRGRDARRCAVRATEPDPAGRKPPSRPLATRWDHHPPPPGEEQFLRPDRGGRGPGQDHPGGDRLNRSTAFETLGCPLEESREGGRLEGWSCPRADTIDSNSDESMGSVHS